MLCDLEKILSLYIQHFVSLLTYIILIKLPYFQNFVDNYIIL